MKLSQKSIKEFQKIYRQDYGVSLSIDQAEEIASNLFQLMDTIYSPIPKE